MGAQPWRFEDLILGNPLAVSSGGTGSTISLTAQSVSYSATIQYDVSTGYFFETTLTGNLTLGTPLNPTDGQRIMLRLRQDNVGGHTIAFGGVFRFGTDLPLANVVLTTTANKTDYLGMVYHSGDSKWDIIAFLRGF
jgi:hypothetical protein